MGSQLFCCSEAKTARAAQDDSPLIQKLFIHSLCSVVIEPPPAAPKKVNFGPSQMTCKGNES
jgi:hypothetical protein